MPRDRKPVRPITGRRAPTFANGMLATAHGTVRCRVLDIFPEGAKIQLDGESGGLADTILAREPATLTVEGLGVFPCVIAWRRKSTVGVRISEGCPVGPAAGRAGQTPESPARMDWAAAPSTADEAALRFDTPRGCGRH